LTKRLGVVSSPYPEEVIMPKKHPKEYTAKLKFQVVLEALSSSKSDGEIARAYNVHPITLSKWKRHFLDNGPEIFSGNDQIKQYERRVGDLERLLGQKEVEIALLKNFLGGR
jgi:transposase-like protein